MSTLEPNFDPRSVEAIEWALWATLVCRCDACDRVLDLPNWSEPPWSEDVAAWAKHWAPQVQAQGWSMAVDGFNLLCPKCCNIEVCE
jgi:hypothetical protein